MFPFIQCQCFDKRRGVYLVGKNQRFIKIRVLFWREISALGVVFNFDNERMRTPKYPSAPAGASMGELEKMCFETLLEGLTRYRIPQVLWKRIPQSRCTNGESAISKFESSPRLIQKARVHARVVLFTLSCTRNTKPRYPLFNWQCGNPTP